MSKTNRQWILAKRPEGPVTADCFELRESALPEFADRQFLVRTEYLSCDPAQRGWMDFDLVYMPKVPIGDVMRATAVGRVVASKHPEFAVGDSVRGLFGWQEYCVPEAAGLSNPQKLPAGLSLDLAISLCGLTGLTAYFGMTDVARVKAGDVVLVSGAAGATGSVAAQIARLKGARVIGTTGGPRKKAFLLETLKLDEAIDYKNEDVAARIAELVPTGLDVFFDNVGGGILEAALENLAIGARITLCGAMVGFDDMSGYPLRNYWNLIDTRSTMRGFLVRDYLDRWDDAMGRLADWVDEGKLVNQVDEAEGIENAPSAFLRLFRGENLGKQIVRV